MVDLKRVLSYLRPRKISIFVHSLRAGWAPLRHPFAVWMLIPETEPANDGMSVAHQPNPPTLWLSEAEFRLMPEMLKLFDFAFAALFCVYGLVFLTSPWLSQTITSYGWMHPQLGWLSAFWWLLSVVALWFFIPVLLYTVIIRPKTLETLRAPLPYAYRDWFLGLPSKVIYIKVHGNGGTLPRLLRLWCEMTKSQWRILQGPTSRDPVVWQPVSSGSSGLLYLSMAQYFSADTTGWQEASKATFRFLITYCSPIWTSFIWLILTISLFRTPGPGRTILCFAWMGLAIFFLLWAVYRYGAKQRFQRQAHLRALPITPLWDQSYRASDFWIIRERWIQIVGGTLPAVGLGLALAALQDLPADDTMCPYPMVVAAGSAPIPNCSEKVK
jgi:hypothetical protein